MDTIPCTHAFLGGCIGSSEVMLAENVVPCNLAVPQKALQLRHLPYLNMYFHLRGVFSFNSSHPAIKSI